MDPMNPIADWHEVCVTVLTAAGVPPEDAVKIASVHPDTLSDDWHEVCDMLGLSERARAALS